MVVWPYPSPPVSPTNPYYAAAAAQGHVAAQQAAVAAAALAAQQQQQLQSAANNGPTIVLVRGLPFNASTTDLLAFFQGFHDVRASVCLPPHHIANVYVAGDGGMHSDPASTQWITYRRCIGHIR